MTRKVGPLIDLKQKLGDLQMGHESEGFLFELLRLLGNRFLQGTYFKQLTRNFCIRQFTLNPRVDRLGAASLGRVQDAPADNVRCTKVKCLQQCRRVAAHLTVAFGEKMHPSWQVLL